MVIEQWEHREIKLQKQKDRMEKHGKGMAQIYKNAILKKLRSK